MLPVLVSLAGFSLSSFGILLIIGLMAGLFTIWRLGRIYDLNEEDLSSLSLISFIGAVIGARVFTVLTHPDYFDSISKLLLIWRYPGLSLWGGVIGGGLTIFLLYRRYKLNLYQILDFTGVGVLIGLIFGEIGCFLGGCNAGIISHNFLSFPVVGLLENRLGVSLIEAVLFFLIYRKLWKKASRFHTFGVVGAWFLIWFSLVELTMSPLKDHQLFLDQILSILGVVLGISLYYLVTKKGFISDVRYLLTLPTNPKKRTQLLQQYKKSWYNYRVHWSVKLRRKNLGLQKLPKPSKLRKLLNVKPTPENFN